MKNQILLAFWLVSSLTLGQKTINDTIVCNGVNRTFRLYVPAAYDPSSPVPLLFNIHGLTGTSDSQESYGDFRPIADTANFIIVHPQGLKQSTGLTGFSNFASIAAASWDLDFMCNLIDSVKRNYNIDLNRVYSTGMSNGGFMSYDLASFRSQRFAAIASVSGTMVLGHLKGCQTSHPMPVLHIHGTSDNVVSYSGKAGIVGSVNVDSLIKFWVDFNHCSPTPVVTSLPDTSTTDKCTVQHEVYTGGDAGSTVEFYKVINGGHTWPGSKINNNLGNTNKDFNASVEIWRFLSQYSLDKLTDLRPLRKSVKTNPVSVYSNPDNGTIRLTSSSEIQTIQLFNMQGQLVRNIPVTDSFDMEFSSTDKGIYLLQVITKDGKCIQKVNTGR